MKKLFKRPTWLKPEIDEPMYYLHIAVIAFVVLGLLQLIKGGEMLSVKNMFWSVIMITLGDIFAHTILKLN